MARFFLLEALVTAGVLYLIFRLIMWITRTTKKELDREEQAQTTADQKEIK